MKKIFKLLPLLLVLLLVCPNTGSSNTRSIEELSNITMLEIPADQGDDIILARRGGGGGSRSFRSRPSRPTSRRTPTKSLSGKRNKKISPNKSTVAKKTAPKRKLSKADKKLANKARKSGKYHNDRKSARADFKKKNAKKYTSSYKTKPATRPSHIPATTSVNGANVNINYNVGMGGYGYMGIGGQWMAYSMMSDVIMMDRMMHRSGYVVATEHGTVIVRDRGCFINSVRGGDI